MRTVNVDIMKDGSVKITGNGESPIWRGLPPITSDDKQKVGYYPSPNDNWHIKITNNDKQKVVVTDCRTLTDTAQYNIGWHHGYRANHNDASVAAAYLEIDKRMVASLKPKDSIGE